MKRQRVEWVVVGYPKHMPTIWHVQMMTSKDGPYHIAECASKDDAGKIATALNALENRDVPRAITTRAGEGFSVLRALKNARDIVNMATFEDDETTSRQQVAYDDLEEIICAVY